MLNLYGRTRLLISFSGGRTSAYMTRRLLQEIQPGVEVLVVFANTGQEHEATLDFVRRCDEHFNFRTVWVEAVVNPRHRAGTKERVVDFATADRAGGPFEAAIEKFGIPNQIFPHCTRELKERPIHALMRTMGWKAGSYATAIGIRADEIDRQSETAEQRAIIYPLIGWGVTKPDVLQFWRQQPFDLALPEHLGNCMWCWKKSLRKHLTLVTQYPDVFSFPERMEALHHDKGPGGDLYRPRRFFRGHRSVADLRAEAQQAFELFQDPNYAQEADMPTGGCSESCEAFA